jgi:Na+-driven multidrug efflux pump
MPFLAVTMILTGALRGAGDTRWPWAFTLIGYMGIRLPTAYVLAHVVGLGVYGAWMGAVVDVVIRSGMVLGRFLHGGWKKVQV